MLAEKDISSTQATYTENGQMITAYIKVSVHWMCQNGGFLDDRFEDSNDDLIPPSIGLAAVLHQIAARAHGSLLESVA